MIKKYYLAGEVNQALGDFKLSIRQIACIRCTTQNFWIVADEEGRVTVSFESE